MMSRFESTLKMAMKTQSSERPIKHFLCKRLGVQWFPVGRWIGVEESMNETSSPTSWRFCREEGMSVSPTTALD